MISITAPIRTRRKSVMLRSLGALVMREVLTRYGRHNIGFLWLFVEPMLFTLGVTALWTATGLHNSSDLPISAFALTGYSSVLLWRNMAGRCIGAVAPSLGLLYHRNVRIADIYLSRILLEGAGATASFASLTFAFAIIGWIDWPEKLFEVALGWILLAMFGAGLALTLGAMSELSELVDKIWHPVQYLMFPLSGAAFLVAALPESSQKWILLLPMVHGVEILRDGYFGSKVTPIYSIPFIFYWSISLILTGLILTRIVQRRAIPE